MSFLVFAVGIVNTGWPRPLAKSRTSGNHCVLVLENVSFERSFSKNHDLCQRAIRCTSTWRPCIRIFQSTRTRDCKFPNRALQKFSAFCEFRFLHLQNQKTNIRKYVITPFSNFENSRLRSLISGLRDITENKNKGPCCKI